MGRLCPLGAGECLSGKRDDRDAGDAGAGGAHRPPAAAGPALGPAAQGGAVHHRAALRRRSLAAPPRARRLPLPRRDDVPAHAAAEPRAARRALDRPGLRGDDRLRHAGLPQHPRSAALPQDRAGVVRRLRLQQQPRVRAAPRDADPRPPLTSGPASSACHPLSNTLGFPLLTGTPIRARLYSGWGLTATQVTRVVVFCFLTFWLGFITLGGIVFRLEPLPLPQ